MHILLLFLLLENQMRGETKGSFMGVFNLRSLVGREFGVRRLESWLGGAW